MAGADEIGQHISEVAIRIELVRPVNPDNASA